MKSTQIFINNKQYTTGKILGKGGEGQVFLLSNNDKIAVKLYLNEDKDRIEKLKVMISLKLVNQAPLISFPENIVTDNLGNVIGFTMNFVNGHKPIHEVYGVKSRKINFPNADFRFLVRAAANVARAVAQVHESDCIIGDINHSGILISTKAMVAIIDADSFQISKDNKLYPCVVGVPDFTPPERQGISLRNIKRTKDHDQFGLAVLIFQLLFMGRHPYAGRSKNSDLGLEEAIKRNIFAYSSKNASSVSPPPGVPTLDFLPTDIQLAFERSFGDKFNLRTTAVEWVAILTKLESLLARCSVNDLHFYPSSSTKCPWCVMEGMSGVLLFISKKFTSSTFIQNKVELDLDKILYFLNSQIVPTEVSFISKTSPSTFIPSENAKKAKKKNTIVSYVSKSIYFLLVIATFSRLDYLFLFIMLGYFTYWVSEKITINTDIWTDQYSNIEKRYDLALENWKNRLKTNNLANQKKELLYLIFQCKNSRNIKDYELSKIKNNHQAKQLNDFLDNYLIKKAKIQGIGPSRKITLVSYGIESAADVIHSKIMVIPGFGEAMTKSLLDWRRNLEKKFKYNPVKSINDKADEAKIENDLIIKNNLLKQKIDLNLKLFEHSLQNYNSFKNTIDPHLTLLVDEKLQLETDLKFLGIEMSFFKTTNLNVASAVSSYTNSSISQVPNCPNCSSVMIRRMAKKGSWRGSSFWGCSRYPRCKGTR